jgi:Double zinc ribbon
MPPIAYFGIESSGLSLAIDLLILFLVVLYGSLVYWTYADARRRIADPMLIGCATVASLFPFVGTIVYMILRPPEYLEDVRERELELQAAEARLHDLDHSLCPHCDYRIERDFVRCPSCLRKLKERCVSCSKPLDRAWTICPYCETDVPAAKPARRSSRRERVPDSSGASARAEASTGADSETQADPLEVLEPASSARERALERAAVRAPEPATFVEDGSSRVSKPVSLASESEMGGEPEPQTAPKPSARSSASRRPRPTT